MLQARQRSKIGNHPCAALRDSNATVIVRCAEIKLRISLTELRANGRQLVKQAALELPRLDLVLLARQSIDDRYANSAAANSIAQLGCQVPLDFLAGQSANAVQERTDLDLRALLAKKRAPRPHRVARIAFAHDHLIGPIIDASRC